MPAPTWTPDSPTRRLADDVDWAAEAAGTSVPGWGSYRGKDQVPGFFAAIGSNVDIKLFYLRGSEDSEQSGFA